MIDRYSSPVPVQAFLAVEPACDGDLVLAIAVAESQLGLTAQGYNIGNVRGDSSESWDEGVAAICSTLNNRYLGNLTTIGELSNGGRLALGLPDCSQAACYAMSEHTWNQNVLAIMSELRGYQVTEREHIDVQ